MHEYPRSSLNEGFVVQPVIVWKGHQEALHKHGYVTAVDSDGLVGP